MNDQEPRRRRPSAADRVMTLAGLSSPTIAVLAIDHDPPSRASGTASALGNAACGATTMPTPPVIRCRTPQAIRGAGETLLHLAGARSFNVTTPIRVPPNPIFLSPSAAGWRLSR